MAKISKYNSKYVGYYEISNRLSEIYCLIEDNKLADAKAKILVLDSQLKERRTETTQKEIERRQKSKRSFELHKINNLISYNRIAGNEEKVKELMERREYIKNNVFD